MAIWGCDVSYGSTLIKNYLPVMIKNGLSFLIFRVGEGKIESIDNITKEIQMTKDLNIPYGLYYAFHPWYDAKSQVDRFFANWQGAQPKCIFADYELAGTESQQQRSDLYESCTELIKQRSNLPFANYTGYWVVDKYMPMATSWLNKDILWNAQYVTNFNPTSWSDFNNKVDSLVVPTRTNLITQIWQFLGDAKLTILPYAMDYNVIKTPGMFEYLFKGGLLPPIPIPTPIPTPTPVSLGKYKVVAGGNINIRSDHDINSSVIGSLPQNKIVDVYEIIVFGTYTWGRLNTVGINQWVCLQIQALPQILMSKVSN